MSKLLAPPSTSFGWDAAGRDQRARQFYKSKVWERTREAYIAYRYGLCERCGAGGKIVHHRVRLTPENIHDPEVTLNWENLELLCQDCHNEEHHGSEATADGLTFDDDGNLVMR